MKSKIRSFVEKMTLRERSLLLCLLGLILLFWISALANTFKSIRQDLHSTSQELHEQQIYLSNKEVILQKLQKAKFHLQDDKTIGSDMLFTEMDSLARQENFTFDLSSPQHEQNGLFTIHSIRLGIKQADLEEIIRFTQKIEQKSPYLNLTAFRITPIANKPLQLNAQLEVQSFEFSQKL